MQPRYYQTASNDAAWRFMFETKQNPLIVLPTGAGKSVVIGLLVKQAVQYGQRVIVLAHRKELLEQNAAKIQAVAEVPVGIYSAGLGQRDYASAVICAGIQSVYDRGEKFGPRGLIVVDEANAYKNVQTKRWKTLKGLIAENTWLWMMTGTPAAQSPTDAYGLAKMTVPQNVPRFFGSFRDMVMYNISRFKWIPKPTAQQTVFAALQPAIRFIKEQCIDLPDITYTSRHAPLTPQQEKYYKILKDDMLLTAGGEEVSTVNAATNLNKLLQISGGAVYTDAGNVIEFDVSNRLSVVQEVIDEASHKVLVFVPFTHTIELLKEYLTRQDVTCEIINGNVSINKRTDIFKRFQEQPDPRVLLIQPQAASHGVTLTAANVVIWYAPVTSIETYLQANARIHRQGQKNPMTVVHITGSPVETKLYGMLQGKLNTHTKLVDLYNTEISS